MRKKLALVLGLLIFGLTIVGPGQPAVAADTTSSWFAKGAVGAVASVSALKQSIAVETFSLEVIKRLVGDLHLWGAYRYWSINDVYNTDPDDHALKLMLFGRRPGSPKPAPYIYFATGATHQPEDTTGQEFAPTGDGGLGLVFDIADQSWGVELGTKYYDNTWIISFQFSLWKGLNDK